MGILPKICLLFVCFCGEWSRFFLYTPKILFELSMKKTIKHLLEKQINKAENPLRSTYFIFILAMFFPTAFYYFLKIMGVMLEHASQETLDYFQPYVFLILTLIVLTFLVGFIWLLSISIYQSYTKKEWYLFAVTLIPAVSILYGLTNTFFIKRLPPLSGFIFVFYFIFVFIVYENWLRHVRYIATHTTKKI